MSSDTVTSLTDRLDGNRRPSAARSGMTSAEKRYAPPSQTGRSPRPGGGIVTRPESCNWEDVGSIPTPGLSPLECSRLDFCGKRNVSRSLDDARCNSSYPHSIRRPASRTSGRICSAKGMAPTLQLSANKEKQPGLATRLLDAYNSGPLLGL